MSRLDKQFGLGGWIVITLLIILPIFTVFVSQSYTSYETDTTTFTTVERPAQEGDQVIIDFSGTVVGETEPFAGGTAEDYPLVLGSDMFIPGFEDAIIGHSAGETFDFNLTFPEDYSSADLAGKEVVWTVTLDEVQEKPTYFEWVFNKPAAEENSAN